MKKLLVACLLALPSAAHAQDFPQTAIDWLLSHHKAGEEQLARDFYWSQFVGRYFGDIRDIGTCKYAIGVIGPKDTCYHKLVIARPLPQNNPIEIYSILVKVDRASDKATMRAICIQYFQPLSEVGVRRCVDWDRGDILVAHPIGPSSNAVWSDYEFTPVK
jgi:hypothetical protein